MEPLIVDTDILIDYFRNHADAVTFLEADPQRVRLSVITVAELYQGVFEGHERRALETLLEKLSLLPVTPEIAEQAGLWSRDYYRSHRLALTDCLIAATSKVHGLRLATLNRKHYPMLSEVETPYRME